MIENDSNVAGEERLEDNGQETTEQQADNQTHTLNLAIDAEDANQPAIIEDDSLLDSKVQSEDDSGSEGNVDDFVHLDDKVQSEDDSESEAEVNEFIKPGRVYHRSIGIDEDGNLVERGPGYIRNHKYKASGTGNVHDVPLNPVSIGEAIIRGSTVLGFNHWS